MNLFPKKKLDLDKIYNENKHFFELRLIEDFTGYIPKDVNEPALKCFKEYGEAFEKWTLWHSWYINRKALNDPLKIPFYNGMMVYLKVINTMARVNSKNYQPPPAIVLGKVETNSLEEVLKDVDFFRQNVNKNQTIKDNKNSEVKSVD